MKRNANFSRKYSIWIAVNKVDATHGKFIITRSSIFSQEYDRAGFYSAVMDNRVQNIFRKPNVQKKT